MSSHLFSTCPQCNSINVIKKGREFRNGSLSQRNKCKDCEINFYTDVEEQLNEEYDYISLCESSTNKTFVVTCAVNNVPVNHNFLNTLKTYCKINNAKLIIVPVKYDQGNLVDGEYSWEESIREYFITDNIMLTTSLKLLAGVHVSPAIGSPLTGFEPFSKGYNLIIPHTQLMMKTVAVSHTDRPAIITTTGSISEPIYTSTKQGTRAEFNHSYSAIVIEEDSEINDFHMRVLNSDESGEFYDVDNYYNGEYTRKSKDIPAIVLGDEHVAHIDPLVSDATFFNEDSIVNILRPKYICRHDVLDFYSGSHHHTKNPFTQYGKYISGKNNSEDELKLTMDYIIETTPKWSSSVLVSSNHNEHLTQWLMNCNPRNEPWNAVLYHQMMYLMLKETVATDSGVEYPNAFELWTKNNYTNIDNIKFLSGSESFKIFDIELACHSDKGVNGSRGSADQYSKIGVKNVIGHSHSPKIMGGSYQTGHSCLSKLDYNKGLSTWDQAHVLIQPNGKRQMIFIRQGKWKR